MSLTTHVQKFLGAQFFDFSEEALDQEDLEEGNSLIRRVCSEEGAVEGSCKRINIDFDTFDREKSLKIFCTTCKQKFEKKFDERQTKFYEVRKYISILFHKLPGSFSGCHNGNIEKHSNSQVESGLASNSAAAMFP